jgi:hypothetical protein
MWDDKQIDAAIDETARQMTAGEPGADFRARVMARLEVRPSRTPLWRPIAVGFAVAAMVLVAVLVRLPPWPPGGFGAPRKPDAPQVLLKPDATYEAKPEAPLVRRPASPLGDVRGLSRADATQVRLKPDATYDLEPLTTAPLDLDSIAVTALAASDSIDIDLLPPAPSIAVTPLDVENEGDQR